MRNRPGDRRYRFWGLLGRSTDNDLEVFFDSRQGVYGVSRPTWRDAAAARRNGEAILANPDIALVGITHQRATFTRADMGRYLHTYKADATRLPRIIFRSSEYKSEDWRAALRAQRGSIANGG